jgi:hypothetical protein
MRRLATFTHSRPCGIIGALSVSTGARKVGQRSSGPRVGGVARERRLQDSPA